MIGATLISGVNRAELPGTATTASNSGAASSTSSVDLIVSYLVPARVRSISALDASIPCSPSRSRVVASGAAAMTPDAAKQSTAIAPPPPVVDTTATRGEATARRSGTRRAKS